ncbi:phosphatidylserine decarboxylase family protein [bacterium]|nr:phosphatidylserine decarboxylase family protein [bacterium]
MIIFLLCIGGITLLLRIFYQCYFLRTPLRKIPHDNALFVSPANGKIIAILRQEDLKRDKNLYKKHRKVLEDWTEGFEKGTLISIMMTPLDVHFQKAPLEATLHYQGHHQGKFLNAMKKDKNLNATFQNEYHSMFFKTPEGFSFRIIQIAGFVARRIVSFLKDGTKVLQGEKIGLIKLGSQVSIVLDEHFEISCKVGDKVIDGETVLAIKKPL